MRVSALLTLGIALSVATAAAAQDDLARARAALDGARFVDAVEAYDAAAAGDGLTREDVIELLRGRALAKHGSRDVAGAEADLVALLSLAPEHELGDLAPPAMQRAFARLRGEVSAPLALVAEATPVPDGFTIQARAVEDVASLVREVRIHYEHDGSWERSSERSVTVVAGARVRYWAEAIGPGGAVIAQVGARETPEEASRAVAIVAAADAPAPQESAGSDDGLAIGLGVAAGVLLIAGVVAVVLVFVLAPEPQTALGPPMERAP